MDYDIVVVGAGPAGSAFARETAKVGIRTLLLEEHREIGRPLHCSGLVTPRTLIEAGVDGDGLILYHIKGALVHGPGGANLVLGNDRVHALVLDRIKLDQLLAEEAVKVGAHLELGTRLSDIVRNDGYLHLTVRCARGKGETVRARLVVGADGWNSVVARWMGVKNAAGIQALSMDAYMPLHPPHLVQVFVGRSLAPGWFGWTIPRGNGLVRIGIGCDPSISPVKPRRLLDDLFRAYPREFQGVKPLAYSGGFIPLFQPNNGRHRYYGDNVLLIGDAARQVKPTSGGGIYSGLVAARQAAQVALKAMEAGDLSTTALAPYQDAWQAHLGGEFERLVDARNFFLSLDDEMLRRLLIFLGMPKLQKLICKYGDIDFQSRLFIQLLKVAPVLKAMLGIPWPLPQRWLRLLRIGHA